MPIIEEQSIDEPAGIRPPHTVLILLIPKSSHDTTTADITWKRFPPSQTKVFYST